MKKEFQNGHAVFRQHFFKIIYLIVTRLPHGLGLQLLHANNENVFVMGAVKNSDVPFGGNSLVNAPKKVMFLFSSRRRFEGGDCATLRVKTCHHMADDTVFTGCVHSLKNDEKRA